MDKTEVESTSMWKHSIKRFVRHKLSAGELLFKFFALSKTEQKNTVWLDWLGPKRQQIYRSDNQKKILNWEKI